ncbi:MAG: helix-turn-helix transcriptional regulator [Chloroflexaceae bacterium]|nr:helix-turn-helix transcriptional regulator [Chloroflexaceae bacterium]
MSTAPKSLRKEDLPTDIPLSVLLFYTAMCQNVALNVFAENLEIGALSLRHLISGRAQRPRGRTLELLGEALEMPIQEIRYRNGLRPTSAPRFNDWLKEKMEGGDFSRAKLTRETGISDGALRNYLSGRTLPDSHQAQRLAETLEVDSLELAKVLVADHVVRNGGQTVSAPVFGADGTTTITGGSPAGAGGSTGPNAAVDLSSFSVYAAPGTLPSTGEEDHLLSLWRKLHPQGRRATLIYIAGLLTEG